MKTQNVRYVISGFALVVASSVGLTSGAVAAPHAAAPEQAQTRAHNAPERGVGAKAPRAGEQVFSDDWVAPEGSIAYEVQHATSKEQAVALLEGYGFTLRDSRAETLLYAKSVDGLDIGFEINKESPVSLGEATTAWATYWSGGKPWIRGSYDEWMRAINYGSIFGTAACSFITLAWGAVACGLVVQLARQWINDRGRWYPSMCLAVTPAPGVVRARLERCVR